MFLLYFYSYGLQFGKSSAHENNVEAPAGQLLDRGVYILQSKQPNKKMKKKILIKRRKVNMQRKRGMEKKYLNYHVFLTF